MLWVIEPRWSDDEDFILKKLGDLATPVILVLNKVDRIQDKNKLLPMMQMFKDKFPFRDVVPISAENGENVDLLCQVISQYLPEQEFIFDEDQLTDKSTRFLIAEIIREKLMRYLGEELPYATTVQIDAFKEEAAINDISATIFVERTSQKAIVIGEGGAGLKKIGTDARRDLEKLLAKKVMLRLWVKVKSNWADDDAALKSLGYN